MATVTTNALLQGIRGTFGNTLVFKTMRGKTYVSAKARKPDKRKESAAQRSTRVTFRQATEWAQLLLRNPEKKLYYHQRAKALKLPNAYTAAITDYMRKPRVLKEKRGSTFTYDVSKPGFAIKQVSAQVTDARGVLLQAKAVVRQHNDWCLVSYVPDDEVAVTLRLMITDSMLQEVEFIDKLT